MNFHKSPGTYVLTHGTLFSWAVEAMCCQEDISKCYIRTRCSIGSERLEGGATLRIKSRLLSYSPTPRCLQVMVLYKKQAFAPEHDPSPSIAFTPDGY